MRPKLKSVWRTAATIRLSASLLVLFVCALDAGAHTPSKSYLRLVTTSNLITGQWDISVSDLQSILPLDLNHDGIVTLEELNTNYANLTKFAFTHLRIKIDGREVSCRVTNSQPVLDDFPDGTFIKIPFVIENVVNPTNLEVKYDLFFDVNTLHRGLMRLDCDGRIQTAVFSPEATTQRFEMGAAHPGRQFVAFFREGVLHIWTGYDHILFLLALLLPSVLQRETGRWRGVAALRPAFLNVFKIVTAFTVAHSLTLSLATLQIVRLPARLTESAIAASVVLAAANNLWPVVRERGWVVAFFFGLVHGFGFANALSDLGLVHGTLALTLLGFNLGVEAGQLAIVAFFLPAAFAIRTSWFYQTISLRLGSAAIIMVAATWLTERVLNLKILPF